MANSRCGRHGSIFWMPCAACCAAMPWYLMPQKFAAHPVLGVILQFTLSMGSVLLFCELLLRWKDRRFRRTVAAKSREARPRQYAAKH